MSTLGNRFKSIRNELRLSQEAIGVTLGMSKQGISAVENDKTFLPCDILSKLFFDYKVNLNWLVCGVGEPFLPQQFGQVKDELTQKVEEILKQRGLI